MNEDNAAKDAALARHELEQAFRNAAEVMQASAEAIAGASLALQLAVEKETAATSRYISLLESALSHQRALS